MTLDGSLVDSIDGGVSANEGVDLFQIPLAAFFGLPDEEHTSSITNAHTDTDTDTNYYRGFLDVDYIILESSIGLDSDRRGEPAINSTATSTILDDADLTHWTYSPEGSWSTNLLNSTSFTGSTGQ